MRIGPIPQNPVEWLALKSGVVPLPLAHSHFGFMISKVLLESTDAGVFEALKDGPLALEPLAQRLQVDPRALRTLLGVVASLDLLDCDDGQFSLTPLAKKWLLIDAPESSHAMMLFDNRVCMDWMRHVGTFLKTGQGLQYHETFTTEEWRLYQNAMRGAAASTARELARRLKLPKTAMSILDIGGSHGTYSALLCKKYPQLHATILDLPEAVEHAAPLLAEHGLGDRARHQAGNVLTDELGQNRHDFVLMASVAHHLSAAQNQLVAQKAHAALKPGGQYAVLEFLRQDQVIRGGDMLGALGDFFFALSSTSGLYSAGEISGQLIDAGFQAVRTMKFLTIPGFARVIGRK